MSPTDGAFELAASPFRRNRSPVIDRWRTGRHKPAQIMSLTDADERKKNITSRRYFPEAAVGGRADGKGDRSPSVAGVCFEKPIRPVIALPVVGDRTTVFSTDAPAISPKPEKNVSSAVGFYAAASVHRARRTPLSIAPRTTAAAVARWHHWFVPVLLPARRAIRNGTPTTTDASPTRARARSPPTIKPPTTVTVDAAASTDGLCTRPQRRRRRTPSRRTTLPTGTGRNV